MKEMGDPLATPISSPILMSTQIVVGLIRYGLKAGDPRRPIAEIKRPFWLLVSKQTASQ